jgi:hypothetical protein
MTYTDHPGNRPDLNAGRGAMFREQGVELNGMRDVNQVDRSMRPPMAQPNNVAAPQQMNMSQQQQPVRQEMRGPQNTDIDNILSGLKTRTIDIQQPTVEDDSMISISSLKDMQNSNGPKRSNRRKNRSDKNTVSLDI